MNSDIVRITKFSLYDDDVAMFFCLYEAFIDFPPSHAGNQMKMDVNFMLY